MNIVADDVVRQTDSRALAGAWRRPAFVRLCRGLSCDYCLARWGRNCFLARSGSKTPRSPTLAGTRAGRI